MKPPVTYVNYYRKYTHIYLKCHITELQQQYDKLSYQYQTKYTV